MMTHSLHSWPVYADDEVQAVVEVLKSGKSNQWSGDQCRLFEQEYARYCKTSYALAVTNGSVALELALEANGIGPGDEVVVTPRSFIASASSAVRVGATPVFADVDSESQNITAASIEAVLTEQSKAIIAVHHAGWPCEMDDILRFAQRNNLIVIEDCAQAHGAKYKGQPVGGLGHVGTFSFCQDKNISTGGEGGMLVTNDEAIWRRAWSLRENGKSMRRMLENGHSRGFRWLAESIGTNARMTEMQAAVGRQQLGKVDGWVGVRQENAKQLASTLARFPGIRVPLPGPDIKHAYYRLYGFVDAGHLNDGWTRNRILEAFAGLGLPVSTGGCPELYCEKAFQDLELVPPEPLPVANELGVASLAFLVHPTLTDSDMKIYCEGIRNVMTSALAVPRQTASMRHAFSPGTHTPP